MKKVISTVLVSAMALCVNTAKADNISLEEAREAAAYFMGYYTETPELTANDLTLVYQIDNEKLGIPASYFFNVGKGGWIIMAGTTTIRPIIGYSDEGTLVVEEFAPNMKWWVTGFSEMVSQIQEEDAELDYPDNEVWTALKTKSYKGGTKADQHVLTQIKWGQGDANGVTFNHFCPQGNNGDYAVVGCVATAMAQIMRYYQHPHQPVGTARYFLYDRLSSSEQALMPDIQLKVNFDTAAPFDYTKMPMKPVSGNYLNCSTEEMHEIARLSYYAGVSVKMGYTTVSSGAISANVPTAMSRYFKYQTGRLVYRGSGNLSDEEYISRLRTLLLNDNVVYMGGASLTGNGNDRDGHAWVCTGYKESNDYEYYMNWGWEGRQNGFYDLGHNNMPISGRGYNFNQSQEFIEGMIPLEETGIDEVDGTELGSAYPSPAIHSVTLPYSAPNATSIVIYNIEGKAVATYPVHAGMGEVTVNVESFPAGVYIYRMNSQSGRFMVSK